MYTGDDFKYPSLIVGDSFGYSGALLGIFDAIAPAAAAALAAFDAAGRNGHQPHFHMVGDPELAVARLRPLLALAGAG
jgi:uncharacterized protein DUF993